MRTNLMCTAVAAAVIALAAGSSTVLAQTSGISVSPHNLNLSNVSVPNSEVCLPCHTPHNATGGVMPLSNRAASTATYTLYNATHATAFTGSYVGLDGGSRLCLSCHDGAIAVDNFGGRTNGTHFITGSQAVGRGGDLTDDHPIGMRYPGLSTGGVWTPVAGYRDPTAAAFSSGGIGGAKGVQLIGLPDLSLGIGCASCHNTHNDSLGDFMRTSNTGSTLCLKCHDK